MSEELVSVVIDYRIEWRQPDGRQDAIDLLLRSAGGGGGMGAGSHGAYSARPTGKPRLSPPTLTDAEREAVEQAATVADAACEEAKRWVGVPRWANGGVDDSSWQHVADSNAARAATLRGLLERLG